MTPEARIETLERENAELRAELARLRPDTGRRSDPQEAAVSRVLADRRVLAHLPDVVMVIDHELRILYLNRTIPSRRVEEMIGTNILDHVPPDQRDAVSRAFELAWQSRKPQLLEVKTLSDLYWESRFVPIIEGGEVQMMLCTSTEITQRRAAERALRESEQRLRHAIEASGMGTWTWNRCTDEVVWDDAMCRIAGIEPARAPKTFADYRELVHPDDREHVLHAVERNLQIGVYEDLGHRFLRSDGEVRHVLIKGTVLRDEHGEIIGLRGGLFDVTERRHLEEQLKQAQKMEAVGQLTAGIAHNFNNLLAVILPSIELCRRDTSGHGLTRLDDIEHAARRASEMIRQLMLFARSSSDARKTNLDVAACARRTLDICTSTFDRRIKLTLEAEPGTLDVTGNSGQLEQVLLNICLNARDAMRDAGTSEPSIALRVEPGSLSPRTVRIRITDNGPGMDESTRARMFEPFFTTKPVGVGTGLGLASAYAIVTDHRGTITCTSRPGRGACFEIELPAASTSQASTNPPAASADAAANAGHETVLLVDDEPLVRRALHALLEHAGYAVVEASNGREALEVLGRNAPRIDLAVIDRSMPEMSGEEVLVHLAVQHPVLPVLFLSGNPGAAAPGAQVYRVLAKPLDGAAFLRVVREALDARSRVGSAAASG